MQELPSTRAAKNRQELGTKEAEARWCPPRKLHTTEDLIEYIISKARKDGDCLTWVGWTGRDGAPMVMWKSKTYRAQRVLYQHTYQLFRPKWMVITRCGNKGCVNAEHLQQISRGDFNRKMGREGGFLSGRERALATAIRHAPTSKMGIDRLNEVMQMRAEGKQYKEIGKIFGITPQGVGAAIKRWKGMGLV